MVKLYSKGTIRVNHVLKYCNASTCSSTLFNSLVMTLAF